MLLHSLAFSMSVLCAVLHTFNVPTLESHLNEICLLKLTELRQLVALVMLDLQLSWDYLDGMNNNDQTVAYHASMLAWAVTGGIQAPHKTPPVSCGLPPLA
jgi:hypothetical protein